MHATMKAIVGTKVMLNSYFLKNNFYPFGELMDITEAFKALIIFILVIILLSLTKGLHFLMRDDDQSTKMAKSLTIRITLSVLLFILIFIGWSMGWITPNHI